MRELMASLERVVSAGLVSKKVKGNLAIYNYTARAAYGRMWSDTVRQARGLIVRESTGEVVARPMPKFFNLGEVSETELHALPWDEEHEVSEKLDGSLGILYFDRGRWDVATRGAFDSPQAVRVRETMIETGRLDGLRDVPKGLTLLVEIIYPENRVVVDYGQRDELVLIAGINTITGNGLRRRELSAIADTVGMSVPVWHLSSVFNGRHGKFWHDENTEGYVVHWPRTGLRVKIKAPDYVEVHKMLNQMSTKSVIEHVRTGRDDDVLSLLPSNRKSAYKEVRDVVVQTMNGLMSKSQVVYELNRHLLDQRDGRKRFAEAVLDCEIGRRCAPMVFAISRGKGTEDLAWKMVRKQLL